FEDSKFQVRAMKNTLSRRSLLRLAGASSVGAGLAAAFAGRRMDGEAPAAEAYGHSQHAGRHHIVVIGRASTENFDPSRFLRSWNFSHLPEPERSRYY